MQPNSFLLLKPNHHIGLCAKGPHRQDMAPSAKVRELSVVVQQEPRIWEFQNGSLSLNWPPLPYPKEISRIRPGIELGKILNHSKTVVHHGVICCPWDIWKRLEIFLVCRARDVAEHPTMYTTIPVITIWPQLSIVLKLKNQVPSSTVCKL